MKTIIILSLSVIVTLMALKRLMVATSLPEIIFGSVVAMIFGLYTLYIPFEKLIKSTGLYYRFEKIYMGNPFILQRILYICVLILMEILFILYRPENIVTNGIKYFLMFLFLFGIFLFGLQIHQIKKDHKQNGL